MREGQPLPADDEADHVVAHIKMIVERLGESEKGSGGSVYRDHVVEIRKARGDSISVKRLRSGAEVLGIRPDDSIVGTPHEEFARISDHIMALAHDCSTANAVEEQATTPLCVEDVEELDIGQHIHPDDGHVHVDFDPECHPDVGVELYYCGGVAYAECKACGMPQVALLIAKRGDDDDGPSLPIPRALPAARPRPRHEIH